MEKDNNHQHFVEETLPYPSSKLLKLHLQQSPVVLQPEESSPDPELPYYVLLAEGADANLVFHPLRFGSLSSNRFIVHGTRSQLRQLLNDAAVLSVSE